ncbi:MAG: c-type cytochrome [Bacteroidia bacterium]|nr:c-type cytochrome [Bacteroidia bacterium]
METISYRMARSYTRYILYSSVLLSFFLLGAGQLRADVDVAAGETLFKQNCSACHRVNAKLIGPQLSGVATKYASDKEWLYKWVQNSPALIQSGDAKAVALWEQYGKAAMNPFPQLTPAEIDNILAYADNAVAPPLPLRDPRTPEAPVLPTGIYYAVLALIGLLVVIALLLVVITATLVTAVQSKEQQEPFTLSGVWNRTKLILQNKFVIAVITTFVLVGGTTKAIIEARTIGLHQGYMPEQPIKFSHKLHAGTNQIACEYCHSGVTKSKNAWIPSVNVCMNCHTYINQGPSYGTEEIAKIYEAAGFDPENQTYSKEPKAVEWVRIHNLPDHAYFNHAQHVVVGGVACQTCHGPIEEMEVVYQYTNLGMGWCVNCHRETKVKVLGEETDFTVEDMGGLDCARCHY